MYLKIHNIPGQGEVIAVCDRELLNITLSSPTCDIIIDPAFYGEQLADETEVLTVLTTSVNANIIGKRVCDLAMSAGIIDNTSCIMIGDIPHAQIYGI
ncbi:MAG TPA: DUF424 domain-containing protein [Methanocorpusculum sp.]|nr:DUF424 domain-containing protein [Methanocorpusculum sp.]HJJ89807.1 DUF424 domain-containing protein [Methanocorpusculum sp.]HJJ90935.1 DUF424 domain-containing protein [Methanocorpusculum sp.]HJK01051.1 DUF424 domain-containing protein [Methanocorpusculum sp.]HJK02233.1 DUF424 domain-containing protein [Methanocorpusculum sp.]